MARIAGINIPMNKHVWVGLTSIFGVGRTQAKTACEGAGAGAGGGGAGGGSGAGVGAGCCCRRRCHHRLRCRSGS